MTMTNYSRTRIEGEPLMLLLAVVLNMTRTDRPNGLAIIEATCREQAGEAFMRAHGRVVQRIARAESRVPNARRRVRAALDGQALTTLIDEVLEALPPTERAQAAEVIAPVFPFAKAQGGSVLEAGQVLGEGNGGYDSLR